MYVVNLMPGYKFTFHYVSILMKRRRAQRWRIISFTFHYVSILTLDDAERFVLSYTFTFHYVSILIQSLRQFP